MTEPTQRRQNPRVNPSTFSSSEMSLAKRIGLAIAGLALVAGLVFGAVLVAIHLDNPTRKVTEQKIVVTTRSLTGKGNDQNKKDAVAAAEALLVQANEDPTKKGAEARITALDNDDYTVMSKGIDDKIEWADDSTNGLKSSTYQTLIALSSVSLQSNPKKQIMPADENGWKNSFGDVKTGSVFVPVSIFTGSNNTFSMEMVYVDSRWKLAPYSLVDAVRLSSAIKNSSTSSTSATPTHK